MSCKLCKTGKDLRNSHIIPEFQYAPLYDPKHRFVVLSTDSKRKERLEQKGFREKLLCGACETKLSRWEKYAQKVIFKNETHLVGKNEAACRIGGIKYADFKLYLLSLIWRMGVSSLEMFSDVSLGPHEEKIRLLLLADDPGKPGDYPCLMTGVLFNGKFEPTWITAPDRIKAVGRHCYRIVISGILYCFFVSNRALDFDASTVAINTDGTFLMRVKHLQDIQFLHKRVEMHSKALNERDSP